MFNRACRILAQNPSEKSTATSSERVGSAKLCESERLSLWKMILIKVQLILQTAFQQNKAKLLLGEAVYNRMFSSTPTLRDASEPINYRFLNGQAVGRQRPPGTGRLDSQRAHMDPAMCQHPADKMRARANKTDKWWICTACLSRWDRLDTTELNLTQGPQDLNVLNFGKHMGSSFQEVWIQDRRYCEWILQTAENGDSSKEIHQFAQYLQQKRIEETYEMDPESAWLRAEMEQDEL